MLIYPVPLTDETHHAVGKLSSSVSLTLPLSQAKSAHHAPKEHPEVIPEPEYPGHFEVRRVRSNGVIKFKGRIQFVSEALTGEQIGLEEVDDGIWSINFVAFEIGRLDQRTWKIY